jgi:DNA-binding PadR family transcriptional regulator
MEKSKADHLHGTLDALILKTLAWGPKHGYGIARWLGEETEEVLKIEEGSLYPALYRLEKRGWIEAEAEREARRRFGDVGGSGRSGSGIAGGSRSSPSRWSCW